MVSVQNQVEYLPIVFEGQFNISRRPIIPKSSFDDASATRHTQYFNRTGARRLVKYDGRTKNLACRQRKQVKSKEEREAGPNLRRQRNHLFREKYGVETPIHSSEESGRKYSLA